MTATAKAETLVEVRTGRTFEAWTEGNTASLHVTKEGRISKAHTAHRLPHHQAWGKGGWQPYIGPWARYDLETEEKATPIRREIAALEQELGKKIAELKALYAPPSVGG